MFERLRKLRTEKGISALKMTEILGLATEGAYYKKETGAIKFSLLEAKAVADFFDMSIEDIFLLMKYPKRTLLVNQLYSISKQR